MDRETPIVCFSCLRALETIERMAGRDNAVQEIKKITPNWTACQYGKIITTLYPQAAMQEYNSKAFLYPIQSDTKPPNHE